MKKIWEAIGLLVVIVIVISIASDAIRPYLPIIGIVIGGMVVLAVGVLLFRLIFARRKLW